MLLLLAACDAPPGGRPDPADTGDSAADTPADTGDPDAVDPACEEPGCVRALESLGSWTRAQLRPYLPAGLAVDNGYEVLALEYWTEAGPATATLTFPVDPAGDVPADGYPVVVNAHGTVGLDDPCQLTGTLSGSGLAGLFGAYGTIGVAPDYPGLGTPGYARYLDARQEGTSLLDAARAALRAGRIRAVPTRARVAMVGLSQGGHAVLAAAALHSRYAPELDVRAFGASGPASVYLEHWQAGVGVPGEHQVMHAMMVWSFAEAAGVGGAALWRDGTAVATAEHLTTRCYWSPNFTGEPTLVDDFPTEAEAIFSPALLAEYTSGEFDAFAFLGERFDANRVRPWLDEGEQTAPIAIWQGTADTTVLPWMTVALVDDLRAGGVDVDLTLVTGATHTTTAFGFLASEEVARDESRAWVAGLLAE